MRKEPIYYLNGKYVAKSKAVINVNDLGFLRSYGVFEFLLTYNNIPFYLETHLKRLENSAETIGINLPYTNLDLKKIISKLLKLNKQFKEKYIHIIITGGQSDDSITSNGKPTTLIMIGEQINNSYNIVRKGIKVITEEHYRDNSSAKTNDYLHAMKSLKIAKSKGATEVIYYNKRAGLVYEGSRSTMFIVKNRKVKTPNHDVLPGITANVVYTLLQSEVDINMEKITPQELIEADEIFITATTKGVVPVIKIDDKLVGTGSVGELTKLAMKKFKQFTNNWDGKEIN